MTTNEQRQQMGSFILNAEARRDKQGRLKVYKLPSADGGGTYEVAGINDRYHPEAAAWLSGLLHRRKFAEAEDWAADYLVHYTDVASNWAQHPATEAFLRDCAFNRGPKGSLRILQLALDVSDDGKYGPFTKAANKSAHETLPYFLGKLRAARAAYEWRIAPPVGARAKFWPGLLNRWDAALTFSQSFLP